jgi:hypothetical protein
VKIRAAAMHILMYSLVARKLARHACVASCYSRFLCGSVARHMDMWMAEPASCMVSWLLFGLDEAHVPN